MELLTNLASINSLKKGTKEKSTMIIEPLQTIIQLAILSNLKVGTKMSIDNNILTLQSPKWHQGVMRWYNADSQEDLYYLYHAIRRYYKWYKSQTDEIFGYFLLRAIKGLEKLINTYSYSNNHTITQTLALYKNLLEMENAELFKTNNDEDGVSIDVVFEKIKTLYSQEILQIVFNTLLLMENEKDDKSVKYYAEGLQRLLKPLNYNIRKWIQANLVG
jgi:hypothetical protein|tara:strand:- start:7234 stop:7887 length:654 start_codon:yes stop_codon:yes gene_type:complete